MYINTHENMQIFLDLNPRKILLEEVKHVYMPIVGFFGTIKRKTQQIKVTTDN